MAIDKRVASAAEAMADVRDGATVMLSGFGGAGFANLLIRALREHGAKDLTIVANPPPIRSRAPTNWSRTGRCAA